MGTHSGMVYGKPQLSDGARREIENILLLASGSESQDFVPTSGWWTIQFAPGKTLTVNWSVTGSGNGTKTTSKTD